MFAVDRRKNAETDCSIEATSLADLSDSELVKLVQQGHREAFAQLARRHHTRVYGAIVRQGVCEAHAVELCQEVLFKAYSAIPQFRLEASFITWVLRITTNHVSNYFNSRAHRQDRLTSAIDSVQEEYLKSTDGFDREAIVRVQELVQQLPESLKEVLVLFAFEQQSYEEIATQLDIPLGTVRSRLYRAREHVRCAYFKKESCDE